MMEDVLSNALYAIVLGAWLAYLVPLAWRRFASDPQALDRAALRHPTVLAPAAGAAAGGAVSLIGLWHGIAAGAAVFASARLPIPRHAARGKAAGQPLELLTK